MTRVLQVCDLHPPRPGGLGAHVARLARQLAARGHDVTVATVAGDALDDRVPVFELELGLARLPGVYGDATRPVHPPWADRAFTAALERVVERRRPEVLHAHGWCMFSAAAVARRRHLPLVVTLHDHGLACPARTLACDDPDPRLAACLRCTRAGQGLLRRGVLAAALHARLRADPGWRFVAVSHSVARTATVALPDACVEVVPNFIDVHDERPTPTPARGPVLFVGPAGTVKGRALLEAAHERLGATGRHVRLALVGGSTTGRRGPLVTEHGTLHGEDLWDAYRAAALVVVCPTVPDACPTVALEAMAFGRPLVATALGGLTDIVRPGTTGILVPPADPDRLAGAVARLLARPARRVRMGEAARRAAAWFSSDAVVPRLERIYGEALSARERVVEVSG